MSKTYLETNGFLVLERPQMWKLRDKAYAELHLFSTLRYSWLPPRVPNFSTCRSVLNAAYLQQGVIWVYGGAKYLSIDTSKSH